MTRAPRFPAHLFRIASRVPPVAFGHRSFISGSRPRVAHEVLWVAPDADETEIKAAYRRLALRCHPDVAGSGTNAAEEFKELESAYSELLARLRGEERSDGWHGPPDRWPGSLFTGNLDLLRLMAMMMAIGVPLGMLAPDAVFGVMAHMRAERALLNAGGWACHFCTFVNPADTNVCGHCSRRPVQADAIDNA
eukprot:TRINITY_DN92193_c0_g1_i1.p1 TRINITY_DN92193_c0_g1~~TRINITY_DN92193_c0_g1_i1.p1  ORF type:complete len:193 (-),score=32.61 TRINITY_DN92193_c0_g1_i1:5-583(-)